jgi:hypothetical protein
MKEIFRNEKTNSANNKAVNPTALAKKENVTISENLPTSEQITLNKNRLILAKIQEILKNPNSKLSLQQKQDLQAVIRSCSVKKNNKSEIDPSKLTHENVQTLITIRNSKRQKNKASKSIEITKTENYPQTKQVQPFRPELFSYKPYEIGKFGIFTYEAYNNLKRGAYNYLAKTFTGIMLGVTAGFSHHVINNSNTSPDNLQDNILQDNIIFESAEQASFSRDYKVNPKLFVKSETSQKVADATSVIKKVDFFQKTNLTESKTAPQLEDSNDKRSRSFFGF